MVCTRRIPRRAGATPTICFAQRAIGHRLRHAALRILLCRIDRRRAELRGRASRSTSGQLSRLIDADLARRVDNALAATWHWDARESHPHFYSEQHGWNRWEWRKCLAANTPPPDTETVCHGNSKTKTDAHGNSKTRADPDKHTRTNAHGDASTRADPDTFACADPDQHARYLVGRTNYGR